MGQATTAMTTGGSARGPATNDGHRAVEVAHLSRFFGRQQVLCDISLQVARGSVCGLLGPNGSGKTTLLRVLVGHLRPTSGEVRILGRVFDSDPLGIRRRLGTVSDIRYLYDWMTVDEILRFASSFHPDWDHAKERCLVSRFSLPLRQRIARLSRGHRARLCLTLALSYNPELIVLDELTSGLDPLVRREVLENIIEEITHEGRTVLFSSHSAEEVERLADQVVIMQSGRTIVHDAIDDLKRKVVRLRVRGITDQGPLAVPGLLSARRLGSELVLTVRDFDPEAVRAALARPGVESEALSLTLDEIFTELVRPQPDPRTEEQE